MDANKCTCMDQVCEQISNLLKNCITHSIAALPVQTESLVDTTPHRHIPELGVAITLMLPHQVF